MSAAVSAVTDLIPAIANLKVAIGSDNADAISIQGVDSIAKIASLLLGLSAIGSNVTGAAQADPSFSAAQKLKIKGFPADLPSLLLGSLLVDYLLAKRAELRSGPCHRRLARPQP